jgi:2,4-dienoyl-CoA reductase-like NADH-dependent reductase (Old Yellow Enzyme family)
LSNRARILLETVKAVRAVVSPGFCVSVKLNSADFQTGGFAQKDAKWVVQQLNQLSVDLVELSGGSYERPAMQGGAESKQVNSSSLRREAFFVDFARDIAAIAQMPIMVTGGILKRSVALDALQTDSAGFAVKMLGIARGLAFEPNLANRWKQSEYAVKLPEIKWQNRVLAALAVMSVTKTQLNRMAAGKTPKYSSSPALALLADQLKSRLRTIRYKRWRMQTK